MATPCSRLQPKVGLTDFVHDLISRGKPIDYADEMGTTPLMYAAGRNHPEVVRILLEAGADPAPRDRDGKSALDYARQVDAEAAVALLDAAEGDDSAG